MKIKEFYQKYVRAWERDDCVNFAVALSRLTGWLLHVDWLAQRENFDINSPFEKFSSLRVYVGDDADNIYDVRGILKLESFNQQIIGPLASARARKLGMVVAGAASRFYSESQLFKLPLNIRSDEEKIEAARLLIIGNENYLSAIPTRKAPSIPAYEAAKFNYGRCAPFAEALAFTKGLSATAMLAKTFQPLFEGTKRSESGYIHSFVMHPDGTGEDAWGRGSVNDIAARFGVIDYKLSPKEHIEAVANLRANSPERFQEAYQEALMLIKEFRI